MNATHEFSRKALCLSFRRNMIERMKPLYSRSSHLVPERMRNDKFSLHGIMGLFHKKYYSDCSDRRHCLNSFLSVEGTRNLYFIPWLDMDSFGNIEAGGRCRQRGDRVSFTHVDSRRGIESSRRISNTQQVTKWDSEVFGVHAEFLCGDFVGMSADFLQQNCSGFDSGNRN